LKIIKIEELNEFVNTNIVSFHNKRIHCLEELILSKLIKKNPYLFKAKNIEISGDLIKSLMDAFLSSSEEKMFGDFLEDLAVFISSGTKNGHKSSTQGIDLEFIEDSTHYLVSIKSGSNWGNSSQHKKLSQDFQNAVKVIKQSGQKINAQPILGICYGKTKTSYMDKGYWKLVGQNFWYFISDSKTLYKDIVEPVGYQAKQHNDQFLKQKSAIVNRLTQEFSKKFCLPSGVINWEKIVEFNSGNFDLDKFDI
jgi:hypothetical protein